MSRKYEIAGKNMRYLRDLPNNNHSILDIDLN